MTDYELTVGLEIHAELCTKTKMFCDSPNDPDEARPNVNVCPVCMGHPGTLPVINKEAVKSVLRFGVAVGGTFADYTEFDRKNYFYPDIPKGYQISQYKYPLVKGGKIIDVPLTRVHLEEDTAKSLHDFNNQDTRNPNGQANGAGKKQINKKTKISIQRYKGLGEMNSDELWETTMDPKTRILKQINIEDARDADRIFDILMGSDVPSRKSFIQSNAKKATLDI